MSKRKSKHRADHLRSQARRAQATGQVRSARSLRHRAGAAGRAEDRAETARQTRAIQRRLRRRDPGGDIRIEWVRGGL